ncbi:MULTISPECIES: acyl carrier protein [Brochothrix]|uniref:Acyl carrier protein n=1 Tax=Brochothrix thermosphacta TaxID=2756 RepID=A0A1D2KVW7_BROTH|nr:MULTISPECIES: acyl carrier protein [Brochothrix]SLM94043.1 Acyl carrier protein [Brachybacterium faecium]ANZ94152.1 acyl carrier protein [Brochothrix thermosphacta]ANZ97552.1 acyl carrier protein [Brochothrix thermosphacta]ATF26996.1 acyl carrier protein [Brochothrix thermosphacta]ATH86353.1 acyl carrier protein [Brochothrix thermosphacta]
MSENIFDKVKEIVIDRLDVDESKVTKEASFKDDLEADSLEIVELVMEFEDVFDTEISDEASKQILTVGDAVKYIEENA